LTFPTRHLFGLDFVTDTTITQVVDALLDDGERTSDWRCLVTPNVDHLVRYRRYLSERAVARHATLILPDGMPIVWASRLVGKGLSGRLTGADLFAELWTRVSATETPMVVVASSDVVAERLQRGHDRVRCVVPPMFDLDDEPVIDSLLAQIDERVDELDARLLVIGVSMPKHHLLANRLRERWRGRSAPTPVVLLLGASPDFALGLTPRAPEWMQRTGLEWVHRLALDPRRMAKRYLVDDVAFLRLVWDEWRNRRSAVSAAR
jgi:N-acetylglucosaminyldiphosphoundecaprenol N-acetyl-beta-D-mannosaminyltransferase